MYFFPDQSQAGRIFYSIIKDHCNLFALKFGMVVAVRSQCCFAEHMANQAHLAKIKNSNNKPLKNKQSTLVFSRDFGSPDYIA